MLYTEASLKHFLRDYFTHQEEINSRNNSELSQRLRNLESTMERVEGTLRSVEVTLQKSFDLQERSLTRQEKTQDAILKLLEKSR